MSRFAHAYENVDMRKKKVVSIYVSVCIKVQAGDKRITAEKCLHSLFLVDMNRKAKKVSTSKNV